MKINDKRAGKKYGDLETGACFELDGEIYIKTNILEDDAFYDMYAVSLSDGTKYEIGKNVAVYPVVAELFIN